MNAPVSLADLEALPLYTPISGPDGDVGARGLVAQPEWWATFALESDTPTEEVWDECERRGIAATNEHPERCDDSAPEHFTDLHAALAYLAVGGTLVKLPDTTEPDCRYWRMFVCEVPR